MTIDQRARSLGLRSGMTLADARAHVPDLCAVEEQSSADMAFLVSLVDLVLAFTPSVALDLPDGLALDITGCAHLFQNEEGLAARLQRVLHVAGISAVKLAIAPTPDMARALARFSRSSPCFADDDRLVRFLPVAALECEPEDITALRRAGLKTIADVADRPTVLFTARFTSAFSEKLALILGEEDRRIIPLRALPPCRAECNCAEPVASNDVIARIVAGLAADVSEELRARGEGGRTFVATFMRADGIIRHIGVETSQPTRNPTVIMRLYQDRLNALADPLDPGFGFDLIRFEVRRTEPYAEIQTILDAHEASDEKLAHLIDRLSTMFGRDRIRRLRSVDSHIPERAQAMVSVQTAGAAKQWNHAPANGETRLRPPLIFAHPHPIEVEADEDERPLSVHWRRSIHNITYATGPERIADEWWRPRSAYGTRDYYRIESEQGRRFWIFRADVTTPAKKQRWFLHGLFP